MKTLPIFRIFFLPIFLLMLAPGVEAQRVAFSMAARLDANATIRNTGIQHYSECNTYLIDGKPYFDAPSVLPFFSTSVYGMKLDFVGFHENNVITAENYSSKGYRLEVLTRIGAQPPRTLTIVQQGALPAFSLSTGNPTTSDARLQVNLARDGKIVASAEFPYEVVPLPDPSEAITTYLPYKYNLQMATLQVIDRENSNNKISADITFGGTVAVQEGKEYIMTILMEKTFQAGEKGLALSINAKQDYGHRVEFEWEGPALPLQLRTDNGMYAYLTVTPPQEPATVTPNNQVYVIEQPTAKERAAPQTMEKVKITEAPKAAEQPDKMEKARPQYRVRDPAAAKHLNYHHITRPINSGQVEQAERSAMQQALRRNPDLLKVKPVAPEISPQEAELAATAPDNTYTLLIHLFNEFGEEDSRPKEVTFVVLK